MEPAAGVGTSPVDRSFPPPVPPGPSDRFEPTEPSTGVPTIDRRRLHPLSPVVTGVFALGRVWPLLLLALARGALFGIVLLGAALILWRWLVWLRTTWELDGDALVVRSGILWRNVQTVPPQRVQQVEVRQALRHRATGLAVVRIGLAGGGDTNQVELDALTSGEAERLGDVLERWRRRTGAASAGSVEPGADGPSTGAGVVGPPVVSVSTTQLVIAGLSGKSLWLAPVAGFAAFVQFLSDVRLDDDAAGAVRERVASWSPVATLVTVTVLALAAAVASTVVSNHGLVVRRSGGDLAFRRGLLEQRSAAVPVRRVQSVELATNVVRERFGLGSLDLRTADLGGSGDDAGSTSLVIARQEDLATVVRIVLPVSPDVEVHRHPPAAVRREVVRRAVRLVPAAVIGAFVLGGTGPLLPSAAVALVAAVLTGVPAGRRLRTGWDDDVVATERGLLARRRWVVPAGRIQSVAIEQNPFQRRLGLASVRLDLAGSPAGVVVRDLDAALAMDLAESLAAPWRGAPAWRRPGCDASAQRIRARRR